MRTIAFWASLFLVFAIPWENTVTISGLGTISRILGFLVIGCWAGTILITGKIRRPHPFHLFVLAFMMWNALSLFWSIDLKLTQSRIITYLQMFAFIYILWDLYTTPTALKAGLQAYVLGAYISLYSMLSNYVSGTSIHVEGRFTANGFNENAIGVVFALGVLPAWYLATTKNDLLVFNMLRLVNYAYIPLAILSMILTGSRGPLVAIIPAIIYILASLNHLKLYLRVIIFVLLVVGLFSLQSFIPEQTMARIASTGDELSGGDLNGRTEIWSQGLAVFVKHPLQGIGTGAYGAAIEERIIAHNFAISILTEVGVIGFTLFITILGMAFLLTWHQSKWDAGFWVALLLVWMLGASSSNFEHRKQTWLFLGLVPVSAALVNRSGNPQSGSFFPSEDGVEKTRLTPNHVTWNTLPKAKHWRP